MANQTEHDPYSWHEALDRSYVLMEVFESTVSKHPVISGNIALKTKAKKIKEAIFDLYQEVAKQAPEENSN